MPEPVIRFLRRGGVIQLAVAAVTLAILSWMGVASLSSSSRPAAVSTLLDPLPLTSGELAVGLTQVGLDARSLAAAGLSAAQTTALVGRIRDYLEDHVQALRDAEAAWAEQRTEVDRLRRLAQAGRATQQDLTALATARSALASAAATRQGVLDSIVTAANEGASPGTVPVLATMRTNRASWDLPTQYLAGTLEQPEWVRLREALTNERQAVDWGEEPDPTAQQFLLTVRGTPAVSTANTNLAALNLAEITAAWNAAVNQ